MRASILHGFVAAFAAQAIASSPFDIAIEKRADTPAAAGTIMKPINIKAFNEAAGLGRRSTSDLSCLDPAKETQLVYGGDNGRGELMLANMTLYSPGDNTLLVTMEAFDDLTSDVDCQGDDGLLSITFKDKEAFDYALKQWSWINEDADEKFLIIANHKSCCPENERKPYLVTDVDNDEEKLITYLKTAPREWEDVAENFDLNFGRAVVAPGAARKLFKRDPWGPFDKIKEKGKEILDKGKEIFEEGKDKVEEIIDKGKDKVEEIKDDVKEKGVDFNWDGVTFSKESILTLDRGEENVPKNILNIQLLKLDCSNCFIKGSFKLSGKASIRAFSSNELSLSINPQDFRAAMEVTANANIKYTATNNGGASRPGVASESHDINLITLPIPGAAIEIPKVFTLGAIVGIDAGFSLAFKTSFMLKLGMRAEIPNDASLFIDLANPSSSKASGWDNAKVTPVVDFDAKNLTVEGAVFLRPKIALQAKITKVGNAEAQINLDLPKVVVNATVKEDPNGACPDSKKDHAVAMHLGAELGLNLLIQGELDFWKSKTLKYEQNLVRVPIFGKDFCYPFELDKPTTTSLAPVTSSSAPASSGTDAVTLPSITGLKNSTIGSDNSTRIAGGSTIHIPFPWGTQTLVLPKPTGASTNGSTISNAASIPVPLSTGTSSFPVGNGTNGTETSGYQITTPATRGYDPAPTLETSEHLTAPTETAPPVEPTHAYRRRHRHRQVHRRF